MDSVSEPTASAAAPFRGAAADSRLGELLIDVLPLACALGNALDLSQHVALCGATWRRGDRGATNDMMLCSLARQAPWLAAARRAPRGGFWSRSQLIRAADAGDERRVRELVAAGASLCSVGGLAQSALLCASWRGHERVVRALLDGKFEAGGAGGAGGAGSGVASAPSAASGSAAGAADTGGAACASAIIDQRDVYGATPLMRASYQGSERVVRLLLERGADQTLQSKRGMRSALHRAAASGRSAVVALLCAAPGAEAALALKDRDGRTPLGVAVHCGRSAACEATLRARGARE
jgi:hypothetical protein